MYEELVKRIVEARKESETIELKVNNENPDEIGEYISALSNSATYHDKDKSYMIWGVHDQTYEVIGTKFNFETAKKGNQSLENYLRCLLSDHVEFEHHRFKLYNKDIVLLIIYKATYLPVAFKKVDYIRIGSHKKKLMDVTSMQAKLWDKIRDNRFEDIIALSHISIDEVMSKLDFNSYFDLKGMPNPYEATSILHYMKEEKVVRAEDDGKVSITNLGAILFAKKLSDFDRVSRKAIRIIQYKDKSKINILQEKTFNAGYATSISEAVEFIKVLINSEEVIDSATRTTKSKYPIPAIREIVVNALVHQDFSITGAGPVIEIFSNRIEVTNTGTPLVDIMRIIDNPPRSRNEKLASLLRNLKLCEEAGSGWDRIVIECHAMNIPTPKIYTYEENTKVTLFNENIFNNMDDEDKLRTCYTHACIKYLESSALTNGSLRDVFGIEDKNSASVSRLIKSACAKDYIRPVDPTTAPKHMKYIPWWG